MKKKNPDKNNATVIFIKRLKLVCILRISNNIRKKKTDAQNTLSFINLFILFIKNHPNIVSHICNIHINL